MKKFSNELLKTYFWILLFFGFTHTISLYFVKLNMNKHIRNEIKMVERFLNIELGQAKEEGKAFIQEIEEAFDERPGGDDVFLKIIYEGKIYQDENFPELQRIKYSPELKIVKNIGFYFIERDLVTKNNGSLQYFIVKNLREEENFFIKLCLYTLMGIFMAVLFTIYVARRFMKKLTPQLQQLESITEKIDFITFKIDIDQKAFYGEFSNFLSSYENMLNRMKQGVEKKNDFINSASHELKTPLAIIKGYSDILKKRGRDNPEIFTESIDVIQQEVKDMSHLIKKLLFLSGDDHLKISLEKLSLIEIVQEIITEMEILYPQQKIKFHPKNVFTMGDWGLLKMAVRNIVDNSIKYGEGNPIHIYIQDRGENVVIYVKDSGKGIAPGNIKNVFDRFYREDKSRSKEIGGHGLGLSIVKTIMEYLGGKIEIKSVLGEKTEVFLMFKKK